MLGLILKWISIWFLIVLIRWWCLWCWHRINIWIIKLASLVLLLLLRLLILRLLLLLVFWLLLLWLILLWLILLWLMLLKWRVIRNSYFLFWIFFLPYHLSTRFILIQIFYIYRITYLARMIAVARMDNFYSFNLMIGLDTYFNSMFALYLSWWKVDLN